MSKKIWPLNQIKRIVDRLLDDAPAPDKPRPEPDAFEHFGVAWKRPDDWTTSVVARIFERDWTMYMPWNHRHDRPAQVVFDEWLEKGAYIKAWLAFVDRCQIRRERESTANMDGGPIIGAVISEEEY
jgi:hypothetical protein